MSNNIDLSISQKECVEEHFPTDSSQLAHTRETEFSDMEAQQELSSFVSLTALDSDMGNRSALSPSGDIHSYSDMMQNQIQYLRKFKRTRYNHIKFNYCRHYLMGFKSPA